MNKVVIFDLDGTLTNTIKSIQFCANSALKEHGLQTFPAALYKYFVGNGVEELIRRALEAAGDKELVNYQRVYDSYQNYFEEYSLYEVTVYDGIQELLEELKSAGIYLAVYTNKPHDKAVRVVDEIFGKGYFDLIVGAHSGKKNKPDPNGIYYIANTLDIDLSDVIYLGDTDTDMMTGKNAGVCTLGVLWGFREYDELKKYNPDGIISFPSQMLKFL